MSAVLSHSQCQTMMTMFIVLIHGDINDCRKDDKLDCNDDAGEEDVNGKNE